MRDAASRRVRRLAAVALAVTVGVALAVAPTLIAAKTSSPAVGAESDAAEFRARREKAAALAGPDAVVLILAPPIGDGPPRWNRNTDFEFVTQIRAREAAVLIAAARPLKEETGAAPSAPPSVPPPVPPPPAPAPAATDRIYLAQRNPAFERWTGPEPAPDAATAAAAGFRDAKAIDHLAEDTAELLRDRRTLYLSAGPAAASRDVATKLLAAIRTKLEGRWVRVLDPPFASPADLADSLRTALPDMLPPNFDPSALLATFPAIDVRSGQRFLTDQRAAKSPWELDRIRRAVAATVEGIRDALRAAAPGRLESDLAAIVELRCRTGGCAAQAFPSIVGSGPNSCVLHYDKNTRTLGDGDLVVLDVGGECEGYAADVTRTFPVSGRFTDEQAAVYDAVLAAQDAALAAVRPGVTLRDVHAAAQKVLDERGLRKFFPHGTSHSVGLDVHDSWRGDMKLSVGSVITVEPGVYDGSRSLGVRIEDTVIVTATGHENLSGSLPRRRSEIEALLAEDPPAGLLPPLAPQSPR